MDHTGKISRAGDGFMRSFLFEAAQCLYFRSKRDTALKSWAQALAARSGTKKALVALARKLAVILHAQLVHGLRSVLCYLRACPKSL
jgi:transposase